MPHLSPMSWLISPLLFCFCLLPMLISSIWWAQTPCLPLISQQNQQPNQNNWNWQ